MESFCISALTANARKMFPSGINGTVKSEGTEFIQAGMISALTSKNDERYGKRKKMHALSSRI